MEEEFSKARSGAVALSARMDERAGLLSEAHHYGHRMSKAQRLDANRAREANARDAIELEGFVAWGLEHRASDMLSWAEAAAALELSDAYRSGWRKTLAKWRAIIDGAETEPGEAPPALSWLITMWHRAA